MTPTVLNDPLAAVRGQRRAEQLVAAIRSTLTAGDELERALRRLPDAELAGFARGLQKALEARR